LLCETWRLLEAYIVRPRRSVAVVGVLSLVGAGAEAVALVLVVRVALMMTGHVPELGELGFFGAALRVRNALVIAAGSVLAAMLVHFATARLSARISRDVLVGIQSHVVSGFVAATWDRQSREREGELQETLAVLAARSSDMTASLVQGMAASLHVLTLLGVALYVNALATLGVVVAASALFAFLRPMASATRRRSAAYVTENSRFLGDVARLSRMAMELRVFGVEQEVARGLLRHAHEVGDRQLASRAASVFGTSLYRDLAMLFLVGAVGSLAWFAPADVASIGAVVLLVVRAANSSQTIQAMRQDVSEKGPNLKLATSRLASLERDANPLGTQQVTRLGNIELRGVAYAYGEVSGLCGIDLVIPHGEVLGLVGPSGSGKSTLVQVVLRLRQPQRGSVTVNRVPYEYIDEASWSRLVALVPQEPQLMEGSVSDNIRFLRPGISDDEVRRAAALAHVDAEIDTLPGGFDALLGPRGTGLSGGQKQRVAIARALVGRPELLVLDEPTSALDGNSEALLRDTILGLKGSVTMIIVAHRSSTLAVCDRIVSLRDGALEFETRPEPSGG
jgi:ATP-binding cassette, subfamily B, bacterial